MTDQIEVLRVSCERNHRIGTVTSDGAGYAIDYTAEVWHTGPSIFGSPSTIRLDDDVIGFTAFCKSCKKSVELSAPQLIAIIANGKKKFRAPFSDAIDRSWTERGGQPSYPPGLGRFRHDPRQSHD
jgi:hypothetical protein